MRSSKINIIKKFINDFEDSNNIINLEKSAKSFLFIIIYLMVQIHIVNFIIIKLKMRLSF